MSQSMCRVQTTTFRSQLSPIMWVPESEPRLSGLGASIFTWYAISPTQDIYCLVTQHDGDNANGAEETKCHRPSDLRYQKLGKDWFSIWNSAWCTRILLSSWMREWMHILCLHGFSFSLTNTTEGQAEHEWSEIWTPKSDASRRSRGTHSLNL